MLPRAVIQLCTLAIALVVVRAILKAYWLLGHHAGRPCYQHGGREAADCSGEEARG